MNSSIRKKRIWIPAGSLLFTFLISLLFFLLNNNSFDRRVLFFPDDMSRTVKGETRFLPLYNNEEQTISLLVKELLLGPE